ncbi:MAG TPA: hypothetical protein DDZ89_14300, partial [Clostridiales bacterium]|nr:hypothetical protein [Clostridiales bacterium]
MRHIRLFNCKDQVEYRFNGSVSVETVYEIKKNAELYFSIKPLVENKIFPNINNPDFLALDKDGLPVVVLFQQDDNACVLSILEYYMELPKEDLDVDWQGAGVICLSEDFHPYDIYLAAQSKRKIELIRYESYPNDLILFETIFPKNKSSEFADLCGTINSTGLYSIIEIEQEAKKIHINLNTDPPSVTFSGADTNKLKAKGNIKGESKDKTVDKPKVKNKVWGIGYCKIQNNKHYAVFPNKDKVEIMDLPDAIYLAEGQFVLVDQYGKFKYVFGSMIENTFYKNEIECFALVVVRGNQTYMDKGDGIYRKFFNDTNIEIRNQTVISIDRNNRFVRYYKPVKFVADSFMSSVKAKGHQMVFVLDISSEGVLLRDVETGKEFTRKLNQENQKLQKHHILCLDQDRFITAFSASKFYTLSTFYKQLRYGT